MVDNVNNEGAENLFQVFNKHFDDYLERYGVATPKPAVKAEPKSSVSRFPVSEGSPAARKLEEGDVFFVPEGESVSEVDSEGEFFDVPADESEVLSDVPAADDDEDVVFVPESVDVEPDDVFFDVPVESDDVELSSVELDDDVVDVPVESETVDVVESDEDVFFDPESAEVADEGESEPAAPVVSSPSVEREILREVLVVDRDQARDLGYSADRYLNEPSVESKPSPSTPSSAPNFPSRQAPSEPKFSSAPRVEESYPEVSSERFREAAEYRPEVEPEKKNGFFSGLFRKADTATAAAPVREYRESSRVREEGLDSSSFDTSNDENSPISLKTQENYDPRAERLRLQHIVTERRDVDPAVWLEETMLEALSLDASDLHIVVDGETRDLRARIRVDGQMRDFDYVQGVPARVIMGRLKAATELSSGGSFAPEETIYTIELDGEQRKARAVLFRVEDGGEALVMRLPLTGSLRQLDELSFADYNLQHVYDLLAMPYKLIMIAGPMGSGKTTTAHGALMHVAKQTRTVWTIEDPVERRLPNLVQLEIDEDNGAGFDVLLSKLLRADYNTLFLGEIRDNATAAAAVRQAKAGRQVMSTIHADDNIKALMRLIELAGDSPLSVLSAVGGVISQRLVRRLNPDWDGVDPDKKYKGRVPIHEILFVDDNLVEVMMQGKALSEIKQATGEAKGSTFAEDARRLIAAGVTDRAELLAVIGEYEEKK